MPGAGTAIGLFGRDGELAAGREVDLGSACHRDHASGHTDEVAEDDAAEDNNTLTRINKLVAEEKALREKKQRGEISGDEEHARLRTVETQLDQCWDLLRQRRALRETGGDPKDAHVRSADQVEGYLN